MLCPRSVPDKRSKSSSNAPQCSTSQDSDELPSRGSLTSTGFPAMRYHVLQQARPRPAVRPDDIVRKSLPVAVHVRIHALQEVRPPHVWGNATQGRAKNPNEGVGERVNIDLASSKHIFQTYYRSIGVDAASLTT